MLDPKPKTVLELFENHPERWTQGAYARDKDHRSVTSTKPEAVCWCLVGALRFIYGYTYLQSADPYTTAMIKVNRLTEETTLAFNDDHTFEEVLDLVRKAGV